MNGGQNQKIRGGLGVPKLKVSYQEYQRTLAELLFLFRHAQFSQEQAPRQKSSQPGALPVPRDQRGVTKGEGFVLFCRSWTPTPTQMAAAHISCVFIMEAE